LVNITQLGFIGESRHDGAVAGWPRSKYTGVLVKLSKLSVLSGTDRVAPVS
jgi:hypothetical protein